VKQVGLRVVFLVCVLLGVCAFQAFAQEATLVGTVTDPSGAAVANAAIKIANTDTGQVRQIATNSEGQYLAPDLQIGHYTVRAEMAGFKAGERKDLVLAQGDRARLDFKLELGSATESVTVEAAAVAVQAESGEVSDVITGDQVSQISVAIDGQRCAGAALAEQSGDRQRAAARRLRHARDSRDAGAIAGVKAV